MDLKALLERSTEYQRMKDRYVFETIVTIELGSWAQLAAATWWCEEQWEEHGRKYRRRIFAADRRAEFEFPDTMSSTKFALQFG